MIKRMIYWISFISFCFFTFLTVEMLPIILKSNWQGNMFLICFFILLILELIFLIKEVNLIKESWSYNSFITIITMYLSIIYYKIYSISLYGDIDISYCKQNYLILSIALVTIIIHLLFLKKECK
jgi:hypothetical protein